MGILYICKRYLFFTWSEERMWCLSSVLYTYHLMQSHELRSDWAKRKQLGCCCHNWMPTAVGLKTGSSMDAVVGATACQLHRESITTTDCWRSASSHDDCIQTANRLYLLQFQCSRKAATKVLNLVLSIPKLNYFLIRLCSMTLNVNYL